MSISDLSFRDNIRPNSNGLPALSDRVQDGWMIMYLRIRVRIDLAKVKAHELRGKSKVELTSTLETLKGELASLRAQRASNTGGKGSKIRDARKNIGRVLTVITQTQRQQLREFYKGKKYMPLDLRAKQTRAIRRRLTPKELSNRTLRQQKKELAFPQRVYAIKA
ncbi:60S ribosomal protein L35, L29 [Dimargaris cristalligena]|uniref:Ribosomal L29 protein-domain-containing protein n=1 Tax=Dimargaris cristalligena TaxID=215637 RepID=A0A4V1J4K6_9FUNG|nr:60S ribosomal protein L35, L29 [Dimargaris cristalligena]RKP35889.1 hypothetical protein BJ085DRAFT_31063 [Dimargaris cristalligena]|eukprot:RKP35889.1 hypothetical protein BJ085DRAFT_31063 [Dimargaris cristalligena]